MKFFDFFNTLLPSSKQQHINFTSSYNSAPAVGTAIAETQIEGYNVPVELVAKLFIEDKEFQRYVFDQYVNRLESMATLIEEIRLIIDNINPCNNKKNSTYFLHMR